MGCGSVIGRGRECSSLVQPLAPGDTAISPRASWDTGKHGQAELRPLSEEERRSAWASARFFDASGPHDPPVALWIVGPSAVGKSTLAAAMAGAFGVGSLADGQPDAVLVDGECFRDAHAAYKRWANSADWATAYPAMKPLINEEKARMTQEVARRRRHMVIPHTCLELQRCLGEVEEQRGKGYLVHVLAVVAGRDDVARRGREREIKTGKRYAPEEFPRSIAAIAPMIQASNGRYVLILATELNEGDRRQLGHRILAQGDAGAEVDLDLEAYVGAESDGQAWSLPLSADP